MQPRVAANQRCSPVELHRSVSISAFLCLCLPLEIPALTHFSTSGVSISPLPSLVLSERALKAPFPRCDSSRKDLVHASSYPQKHSVPSHPPATPGIPLPPRPRFLWTLILVSICHTLLDWRSGGLISFLFTFSFSLLPLLHPTSPIRCVPGSRHHGCSSGVGEHPLTRYVF